MINFIGEKHLVDTVCTTFADRAAIVLPANPAVATGTHSRKSVHNRQGHAADGMITFWIVIFVRLKSETVLFCR